MDNGHSFDSTAFYGNEQLLFQVEILLLICMVVISGNILFSLLFLGITSQVTTSLRFIRYIIPANSPFASNCCKHFCLNLFFNDMFVSGSFADIETYDACACEAKFVKSDADR